jgi:thioesterase domain-containing protein/acyl carrier protein
MVPAMFVMLDRLPLLPNGKVDRRALPVPDAGPPALERTIAAPRSRLEERLAGIWAEVLGIEQIGIHDDFFELGGHSLLAVRLFSQIERAFGKKLPLSTLLSGATIKDFAEMLQSKQIMGSQGRVLAIQPEGMRRPLFFLPTLMGELLHWRELADNLGPGQPCYGLQPRQSDGAMESFSGLSDQAGCYLDELRRVQPRGPYNLAGYSSGGILAFEVAQQLVGRGEQVSLLAIVDGSVASSLAIRRRRQKLRKLAFYLRNAWGDLLQSSPGAVLLHVRTVARSLVNKFRMATPDADIAERQALVNYLPRPYPGRMTLFRTRQKFSFSEPDLGWGLLTGGSVQVEMIPGDHLSILRQPQVRILTERFKACLEANGGGAAGKPRDT